jgi:CHAD domain-containing protein
VLGNASDIAHGDSTPEQLHQLRVGLRRLRGALRDLGDLVGPGDASPQLSAAWAPALATLFAGLGATRDRDALAQTLLPALRKAGAATLQLPDLAAAPRSPQAALREVATTRLWLELLAFAAGSGGAPLPFEPQVRQRLDKLHRQIRRDAKDFAALDDVARHRLRKRVKRLRYLCEFAGSLYRPKRVRAFLKVLGPVQDALGAFNDLSVARALFEAVAESDPQAMFALGWLARERDAALLRCAETLKPLRKAEVFW